MIVDERFALHVGDCQTVIAGMADNSVDSIVTDPPYERQRTSFHWDGHGVAFDSIMWAQCARVLKPGGHLLAFGHSKTYHHLVDALERAGFEYRDMLLWQRQASFPVSTHVSKKLDGVLGNQAKAFAIHSGQHAAGAHKHVPVSDEAKQWHGWGTAVRNSTEPIALCRKPLIRPPRLRTPTRPGMKGGRKGEALIANIRTYGTGALNLQTDNGLWPSNVFAHGKVQGREKVDHPTQKPIALMADLCRLVTPTGGLVLDPFCGSGSTGVGALMERMTFIGIDLDRKSVV